MRAWRWMGSIVLVFAAAFGVTAFAQQGAEKAPIWTAFDNEKPFWQEMTTDTKQSMKVQGMTVEQNQKQTFFVKWTPKKVDPKTPNKWEVDYEITGVKMDITIGGNPISYDSANKDKTAQNPLTDFFGALVGSKFKLTVTRDEKDGMKVTEVDGLTAFVDKLTAANDQLKPLLKSILTPEAVKQMSNPTFAAFPPSEKEWEKKEWVYPVTLNMGPIGSYETTYTYKVNEKDKSKIDILGKMKYLPPEGKDSASIPFTIKPKSTLNSENISGSVTIDRTAGRIADSEIKMDLKGNLVIDIAGMETTVELTQKQTSKVRTSDTELPPPAAPKK